MRYEDFELQVKPAPRGTYALFVRSPAGEAEGRLVLPRARPPFGGLQAPPEPPAIRNLSPVSTESPAPRRMKELGRELFEALLDEPIGTLFHESLARVGPSRGLRLKLRLDLADPRLVEVASLPWELLYSDRLGGHLAIRRRTPIVRYVEVPRPAETRELPDTLRVLVMAAGPAGLPPLDLARERRRIEESWGELENVEVTFVDRPTREGLAEALRDAARGGAPHHVLHFMGHGRTDPANGQGELLFARDDGSPVAVSGEELARELADFPELRFVFLNACESGASPAPGHHASGSVAAGLVRVGVLAVVAMQRPISDRAAIELSRVLYGRIAAGDPLDTALTEGRLALDRNAETAQEWAIPVLFLRLPDGRLFEPRDAERTPWWRHPAAAALLAALLVGAVALAYLDREQDPCAESPSDEVRLLTEAAARSIDARRYDEAARTLRSALDLAPSYAGAHSALGYVEMERGRYAAARESLTRAARELPECAVHAFNLGSFHLLRREYEQAAQSLRRTLELDPDRIEASAALGRALLLSGGPGAAREVLEEGLQRAGRAETAPEGAVLSALHANLGRVALAQQAPAEAVEHLERAHGLLPTEDRRRLELVPELAEARAAAGGTSEACRDLGAVLPLVGRAPLAPWERRAAELGEELACSFDGPDAT